MEILIPGHRNDSPELRNKTARNVLGYLPAWRVQTLDGRQFYVCGKCFGKRGAGPATNVAEFWTAGAPPLPKNAKLPNGLRVPPRVVPEGSICEDCGGPAWPAD